MAANDVISSLVVEVAPGSADDVAAALEKLSGVEVHETHETRLVVTIEAESVGASSTMAGSFSRIPGVLTVNLVYVNCEGLYDRDGEFSFVSDSATD